MQSCGSVEVSHGKIRVRPKEPREYFGGENYFLRVQQLDAIKKEKCDNANVALFYIKYTEIKNIETIVDNIIDSYLQ